MELVQSTAPLANAVTVKTASDECHCVDICEVGVVGQKGLVQTPECAWGDVLYTGMFDGDFVAEGRRMCGGDHVWFCSDDIGGGGRFSRDLGRSGRRWRT
jgi:hypothetical protein